MNTWADSDMIDLFRSHEGRQLDVQLRHGTFSPVFNIAWGYDMGDSHAHITSNISPEIDGQPIEFFYSYAVVAVSDAAMGDELYRSTAKVDQEKVYGNWTKDTIEKLSLTATHTCCRTSRSSSR